MVSASIAVFLFFFSLALVIHSAGTALSTPDDPYYHLRHALSYGEGSAMQIPVFSTMRTPRDDLYVWYHRALAPFARAFGTDASAAIMGSKVFHALGAALFFLIFFLVLARYLGESRSPRVRHARIFLALLGSVALFAFSPIFFFRLLLLRPHVFVASLLFLAFVALERRRSVYLFLLAALLPLFYGASFLLLLPLGLYTLSLVLYRPLNNEITGHPMSPVPNRSINETILHRTAPKVVRRDVFEDIGCLCRQFRYSRSPRYRTLYAPLFAMLSGIALGTALHTDPLRYLWNGTLVHLMAIVNRFRDVVPQGGELYAPSLVPAEIGWLALLVAVLACMLVRIVRASRSGPWQEAITFREFYFLLSSAALTALTFFISRAAEYALPVVFLTLFWIAAERLPEAAREVRAFVRNRTGSETTSLAAVLGALLENFDRRRRLLGWGAGVLLLSFMAVTAFTAYTISSSRSGDELRYRGAALAMAADSRPGSLVFNPDFSEYPRLVFWNTHNTYATGMDPTFTYFFDRSLYWLLYHTGSGAPVCPWPRCKEGDPDVRDPYDFLAHDIGAEFAFVDSAVPSFDTRYLKMLKRDPRFELFYADPEFPEVQVFRVVRRF